MPDGSIVFETKLDNKTLGKDFQNLKKEINDTEKNMDSAGDGIAEALDKAKETAGEILKTSEKIRKVTVSSANIGYDKKAMEEIEKYASSVGKSSISANEMRQELEEAKKTVSELEDKGMFFGDEEYDQAIIRLEKIRTELRRYKAELISPDTGKTPAADTLTARIEEAKLRLEILKNQGLSVGDEEYDKAYRSLALLRAEQKKYLVELSKTPEQIQAEASKREAAEAKKIAALEAAAKKAEETAAREAAAAAEAARLKAIVDSATVADPQIVAYHNELKAIQATLADLKAAGIGPGYEQWDAATARAREIQEALAKSAKSTEKVSKNTTKSSKAMQEMEKRTKRFSSRLREIATGALFFNLISRAMSSMVQWTGNVIKSNDQARASIAQLKGALLTLAQPIINVVIPAFISLVNIITRVISVIAALVSRLFGTTAKQSADAAKNLNKQAAGYGGVSKAAKEASKSIMGFDELNTLQADADTGDTGGGGSGIGDSITPDFSGFDSDLITNEIEKLTVYLSGALLALGAVLTFSGANIPLGIGLMAAGALGLASVIVPNWNAMDEGVKGAVDTVLLSLAGSGLVIGAILAFSGVNIPLGIGLMAVGALSLAAEAALNWNSISPHIEGALATIEMILGAAVLGIGAVLAFTGVNIPLGIAMIAAGAVGLARSQTVDWNSMATALKGPLGTITAIASGFLLALGLVLAFSGVGLPLGIGLIFAGCAGLVTTAAVNWDSIVDKLKEVWGNITSWFNSNVAPKLTLGYWNQKLDAIKQGFSSLWTSVRDTAANIWDGIVGTIKGAINGIISAINGMISGVVNGINIVSQTLNAISFDIPSWVPGFGGMTFGFRLPQISAPQIPYLAQGAVIPPNREFLAVLGDQKSGTNIEAPLSTIEDAVSRVVGSSEQIRLLQEQNDLLRQILAKSGTYLDGKETAAWLAPYQRQMERARGW